MNFIMRAKTVVSGFVGLEDRQHSAPARERRRSVPLILAAFMLVLAFLSGLVLAAHFITKY